MKHVEIDVPPGTRAEHVRHELLNLYRHVIASKVTRNDGRNIFIIFLISVCIPYITGRFK